MKRIATGLFAVVLTVAMAVPAFAAELNVTGAYKVAFVYREGFMLESHGGYDHYFVHQNSNVAFNFKLDENTKVVFDIGTPNSRWGAETGLKWGGDDSTNDRRLRLNYSYVDWKSQDWGLSARVGLQQFATPGFALGPVLMNWKVPAVNVTKTIGDVAAVNLAWIRFNDNAGVNDNVAVDDEFDMLYVGIPIRLEGMTFLPWGEYSMIGKGTENGVFYRRAAGAVPALSYLSDDATMWHVGFTADLKFGDAFVKFDSIYGATSSDLNFGGNDDANTKGYYAAIKAGMKMDFGTPTVALWYSSGNDEDDVKDGDYGLLPVLFNDGDPAFWPTSAGARAHGPMTTGFLVTNTGIGTTGVALALENMSFVDKLFHTPRVAYWMGTSDEAVAFNNNPLAGNIDKGSFFSKKDRAYEVSFDSRYDFSKNLKIYVDLGLVYADWNEKGPNGEKDSAKEWEDTAFRAATAFVWLF